MGLNVHHGDVTGEHTGTLVVREIKAAVTRAELSKLIANILQDELDITMSQIYSIITDNGSNALEAGKLMNSDIFREVENFEEERDSTLYVVQCTHLRLQSMTVYNVKQALLPKLFSFIALKECNESVVWDFIQRLFS